MQIKINENTYKTLERMKNKFKDKTMDELLQRIIRTIRYYKLELDMEDI